MAKHKDVSIEIFRLREVLKKFSGYEDEQLDPYVRSILKIIDHDDVEGSYRFLKSFNDDIEDSMCYDEVTFEDFKHDMVPYAQRKLFVSKVDNIIEKFHDKSFHELEEIELQEYNDFIHKLAIFWHGKELVSELYKSFYGMNKDEMQHFFSENGINKSAKNGYIGYMPENLLKYHIATIILCGRECDKQKENLNENYTTVSNMCRNQSMNTMIKIGTDMKNLYNAVYKKTPFEDLKEEAFAQETMKGFFPER